MSKLGTIYLYGASGTKYEFKIYSLDTDFKAVGAVYAFTKSINKENKYSHTIIYIGQTDDLSERFDNHHKKDCIESNGANCICVHIDNSENSRLNKESDLIKGQNPVCND